MDTRSLETASAATLALVGATLLLTPSTFGANPTAFAAMTALPEWAWGGLLMSVGLLQSYTAAVNVPARRRWAAILAVTLYSFLATLYFIANPVNLGTPTWAVYAAGNLYALVMLGRRHGE